MFDVGGPSLGYWVNLTGHVWDFFIENFQRATGQEMYLKVALFRAPGSVALATLNCVIDFLVFNPKLYLFSAKSVSIATMFLVTGLHLGIYSEEEMRLAVVNKKSDCFFRNSKLIDVFKLFAAFVEHGFEDFLEAVKFVIPAFTATFFLPGFTKAEAKEEQWYCSDMLRFAEMVRQTMGDLQ